MRKTPMPANETPDSVFVAIRQRFRREIRGLHNADFAAQEIVVRKQSTGEVLRRLVNRPAGWIREDGEGV